MAGFHLNLLDEPTVNNPFADASVQEIILNTRNQFVLHNFEYDVKPCAQDRNEAINIQHKLEKNKNMETEELLRKQEELERKERKLAEREKELRNSAQNVRRSNWPPLPDKCCFQPCFYQDIQVDIPVEFQRIVYNLYYLWILHAILLLLNTTGGIVLDNFNIIGEGLLYFLLFTPLGYICWFRPAYKAFRSDSSFNFMVFFFMFFFQLIISCIHAIGATGCGTIGILTAIITLNDSNIGVISKIFIVVIAMVFVFAALADLYLISKIHRIYRNAGASFEKAQQEFANEFLQNEHVKSATRDAIRVQMSELQKN